MRQSEVKDLAGASETLALAARDAGEIQDPRTRAQVFTPLSKALVMADDRLAAGRALAKAEAAAAKIEEPLFRGEARVKVAQLQAILKSEAVAFATLQAVAQESLQSTARTTGQTADPDVDVDLALSNDVVMLLHIAVVYHELGGQDEARRTIDATLSIIDKMKDARDRSLAGRRGTGPGEPRRARSIPDNVR